MDTMERPPFTLHHDAFGRWVLTDAAGRVHVGVLPVRGFPYSAPREGVSLVDENGREVLWLPRLDDLPEGLRRAVEEELARREFVPVIRRVHRVSPRVEPSEWDVDTDRGRTRFVLASADDVRRLDERQATVTDAHGVRYLIPDLRTLDAASRRILERYL
jgi:hypothetical protein